MSEQMPKQILDAASDLRNIIILLIHQEFGAPLEKMSKAQASLVQTQNLLFEKLQQVDQIILVGNEQILGLQKRTEEIVALQKHLQGEIKTANQLIDRLNQQLGDDLNQGDWWKEGA